MKLIFLQIIVGVLHHLSFGKRYLMSLQSSLVLIGSQAMVLSPFRRIDSELLLDCQSIPMSFEDSSDTFSQKIGGATHQRLSEGILASSRSLDNLLSNVNGEVSPLAKPT